MERTERQKIGIKHWLEAGAIGTLEYGTGVGKTRTAIMAIQLLLKRNPKASILISVPTKYLKNQWLENLQRFNITNCEVLVVNTIVRHSYNVDLLVIDEIHTTASDMLQKIFTTVKYKMILGLTATLERLDGREVIIKKYAPVCDRITLEEATKEGWVSPIKNYLVLLDVDLQPYKELDRKFNSYFAFFNFQFDIAMKALQDWKFRCKYAKEIGSDPKTVLQMSSCWMKTLHAKKSFIENHPKKIEICRQIIDAKPNTKGILFCPTIKFAKLIKRGKVLYSAQKASENKKIMEEFNIADKGWLASSKMLNEGVDIQGLTTGIIMNVNSSKITSVQKTGRCCRFAPNKTAEIFTLVIKGTQEVKWFNNSNTSSYITINDSTELDKVLNGEEFFSRQRNWNIDTTYRF